MFFCAEPTTSQASILQIRLLSQGKALILTLHKLMIFDLEKREQVKVLASAHKTAKEKGSTM